MNGAAAERRALPASKGHQLVTLVGFSLILFEIIFLILYSNKFWFSLDIRWLGIPVILFVALVAHFVLKLLQSNVVCGWVQDLWKGKPLVAYSRWIELDDRGFTYGIRHIDWSAVDELFLTFFGNLELRSNAFSGMVFKLPFGIGSPEDQKQFVEAARAANANVRVNKRLESRINSPIVKGQNVIQLLSGIFMAAVLLDVGYSLFNFLETLKHYYLAESVPSQAELQQADYMHEHPLPISWVTNGFLRSKASAADVYQFRAKAHMALGDLKAAATDADTAISMMPDSFRLYLLKARILSLQGQTQQANDAIKQAIEHHKNSLLPRLYLVANEHEHQAAYATMMKELSDSEFADEPRWPGINNAMNEAFYSDDVHYIFDQLISKPQLDHDERLPQPHASDHEHSTSP